MSRFTLAFACFFRLLFGGRLPARAAVYLPEGSAAKALPEAPEEAPDNNVAPEVTEAAPEAAGKAAKPAPRPRKNLGEHHRDGALAFLALLQREGRLIDFLQEDLEDYDDADIGAAVRDIHRGCRKVLAEHLSIEPVMPGAEDDAVKVPSGFDPGEVRLVGEVGEEPPFSGTLRHHGWRVVDARLPSLSEGVDRRVLAPAEVEVA